VQFLFTHHDRRLSQNAVREELDRAATKPASGTTHADESVCNMRHAHS
jgi:hypothetical protein